MGPNHQDHRHQQDSFTNIGGSSLSTANNDNCHSNGGGGGSSSSKSNNHSNGNSSTSNNFSYEVCRDFLRNVCRRGSNCRYRHPERNEAEELGKKVDLIFCHDYQNKECRRSNCRFIHCTKQEEDIYRATGKLPIYLIEKLSYSRLSTSSPSPSSGSFHHNQHHQHHQHHHHPLHHNQQADFMKSAVCDNSNKNGHNSSIASNSASSFVSSFAPSSSSTSFPSSSLTPSSSITTVASPFHPSIPVCKDNLKGDCLRGLRCKFRHISQVEYDLESRNSNFHSTGGIRLPSMDRNHVPPLPLPPPPGSSGILMDSPTSYQGGLAPPEPKRRAYDSSLSFGYQPPLTHPQRTSSSLSPNLSSLQSTNTNHFEFSKPEPPPPSSAHQTLFNNSRFLEDENYTLRRHIEELKKLVADLMASNELLMEQNAQLRTLGAKTTSTAAPLLPLPLHPGPSASHSDESFIGTRTNKHDVHQQQQHFPVAFAQL